jgi:MFS family permease
MTDLHSRLGLGLVLATLDTTIVATSLLDIASDLGHFDKASWVVVSYFLTYSGFLLVFARISDVFGKKSVLTFAVLMFLVWSIACAIAQTIVQL